MYSFITALCEGKQEPRKFKWFMFLLTIGVNYASYAEGDIGAYR